LIMEVNAVFNQCVMRIWSFSFLFERQDDEWICNSRSVMSESSCLYDK
jgi:hypothetical protein